MAVTQATTLADFTSGIGTAGAVFQVDNANNRIGIGTTNPQTLLDVDGDSTFRGNALFGDSDKAVFGAGQDLQIYHNNTDSIIADTGTGNLNILGDADIAIINAAGDEYKARFTSDGAAELYYDGSKKFETTGIGISVSNGAASTATIAGPANLVIDPTVVGDNTGLVRIKGDLFVDGTTTQINSTTLEISDFVVGIASTATTDLLTDGAGIKIGPDNTFLYEHNGGTNASLKSSENLNVASGKVYQIGETERLSADTLSVGTGATVHSPDSNTLTLGTNGSERLRVTSGGGVLIGGHTSAVDVGNAPNIEIVNTSTSTLTLARNDISISNGNDIAAIRVWGNDSNGTYQQCAEILAEADGDHGTDDKPTALVFKVTADGGSSPTERLRLNSDGKLILSGTARTTPFIVGDGGMCIEQSYDGNLRAITIRNKDTDAAAATSLAFSLNRTGSDYDFISGEIKSVKEQSWTIDDTTIDSALVFSTNQNNTLAEKLRITSAGLIGINTTPGTLLEIKGESSKEATVTFNRQPVQSTNDGVIGEFMFENATDSVALLAVKRESAADDAYFQFATQATSGGLTERLRIASNGYVGMNLDANTSGNATLTPWTNLHVVGSNVADGVNARTNSTPTGQLHVSSSGWGINKGGTISLGSEADNVNPNAAYASISGRRASATSYHYQGYLSLNVSDGTTLDEKVRIKSDGKVGIGTDNPSGKLHVSDGANGLEFNVNSQNAIVSYDRVNTVYRPNGLQGSTVSLRIGGVGTALHVDSSAKVGIGTDIPQSKLEVAGTISQTVIEYPTIRPTLDLNFAATKVLDDRITFTRDSIGTYIDENGLVKYASNNVPRFDHDPATGESLGLLVEESRTNLVEYGDFTTGWTEYGGTATSTTETTAPDGTFTAKKITSKGDQSTSGIYDSIQYSSNTTYTHSMWLKAGNVTIAGITVNTGGKWASGNYPYITVNLSTGAVTASGGVSAKATEYPNGWYRLEATGTFGGNTQVDAIWVHSQTGSSMVGNTTGYYYVWGPQAEQGNFGTSYIPTSGSSVTRAVDTAVIRGTNFSDFYNSSASTLFMESKLSGTISTGQYPFVAFEVESNNNRNSSFAITRRSGQGVRALSYNSSGTQDLDITNGTSWDGGTYRKFAYALDNSGSSSVLVDDGTVIGTDSSYATSSLSSVDILRFADHNSGGMTNFNVTIKSFKYYNKRLTNAQLQGLTQQ